MFHHVSSAALSAAWRLASRALFAALIATVASCGGGGGGGNGSTDGGSSAASATAVIPGTGLYLYPDQEVVASGQSVTLNWLGVFDQGSCTASGGWTGQLAKSGSTTVGPLSARTSFTLACVDDSGRSVGQGTVTVDILPPVPAPTASLVVSNSGLASLSYVLVNIPTNDAVWDATRGRFIALTTSTAPTYPSSIVAIDPYSGQVTASQPLASAGFKLALSADGRYAYVGGFGFDGSGGTIQRLLASDFSTDISFSVGTSTTFIQQIAVSPTAPGRVAVVAQDVSDWNVMLVDDGVIRPNTVSGSDVNWRPDGASLLLGATEDVAVSDSGLSLTQTYTVLDATGGTLVGNLLYLNSGHVMNLDGPVWLAGVFAEDVDQLRLIVPSRGKDFSMFTNLRDGLYADGKTLLSSDPSTFAVIDSITFNGAALFNGGHPMIAWGTDGIAIAGAQILIAHGSFAAAGGAPAAPQTLSSVASGSVAGSKSSIQYSVLDIGASDVVADSCHNLYVAMSSASAYLPNTVIRLDPVTLSITGSMQVGADPNTLAVSDDCSTLYVGLQYSDSVKRLHAADLSIEATIPLSVGQQPYIPFARSISVAPGQPHTVAVARNGLGTLCNGTGAALTVYDGTVARPSAFGSDQDLSGATSVVWGKDASTLYAEDSDGIQALSVDAAGLHNPLRLLPYVAPFYMYDSGRDLYFDAPHGRLMDSFGRVFDTAAGKSVGTIAFPSGSFVADGSGCGSPSAAQVVDASSGKVFLLNEGSLNSEVVLTVSSYDPKSLAQIDQAMIRIGEANLQVSTPKRMIRPDANSLVFVTDMGYLFIVKGSLVAP